jgi:hypothetical protein
MQPLFRPPTQHNKARGMGIADQPASQPTQNATSVRALLLATFTAAITLSAALLFMVQPMFTKLRRVGFNYLIQQKIVRGRVPLVSA